MISKLMKRESQLLSNDYHESPALNISNLYNKITNENLQYNSQQAQYILEHWENLSPDATEAAVKAYFVLEQAYLNDTDTHIETFTRTFTENIVPKVRSGSKITDLIKRRFGQMKAKLSTKISSKLKKVANINAKIVHPTTVNTALKKKQVQREAVIDNSISKIVKSLNEIASYDRIIANHAKISKRFYIDKYVTEKVHSTEQAKDTVIELCKMIDTYNISESAKFNIAIENILYLYNKHNVPYNAADILESAAEYFLSVSNNSDTLLNEINSILENTTLYSKQDIESTKIIKEAKNDINIVSTETIDGAYFDENVKEKLKSFGSKVHSIAKELKNFKLSDKKSPKDFKDKMAKAFADDEDNIIRETPNVLGYVLSMFVIASGFAIGMITGIITMLTVAFLNQKWNREEVDKQIASYEKHIKRVESMIKNANKQEKIDRLEEYKNSLEVNLNKLKERKQDLKSDAEIEEEENESNNEATIKQLSYIKYIADNCDNSVGNEFTESICSSIDSIPYQYLSDITEFAVRYPDCIDNSKLRSSLATLYSESTNNLAKHSIIYSCMSMIDNAKIHNSEIKSIKECAENLYAMINTKKLLEDSLMLNELSLEHKLDMAKEKLKSIASNLHEKEKALSKGLDMSIENIQDTIKHSMDNENREAVIRNQLLPPASRIIKTAIVSGLAWCIHPALAVITVLSTFVISKKARQQERQIISDELEVELTMCNKYIKNAEDNNDMKKLRQLLTIKKKLEYERDRLHYKMKFEYDEKYRPNYRNSTDNEGGDE